MLKRPGYPAFTIAPLYLTIAFKRDVTSAEVFGNDGKISMSTVFFPNANDTELEIFAQGGTIRIVSLEVNRLESIWLEADARVGRRRHVVLITHQGTSQN